jgi:pimeloyl-ACP methyl ester carboxylesterase
MRFCRPDLSPYRPADHANLIAKARVHLVRANAAMVDAPTGPVQVYTFEPMLSERAPRTHLLIHGWTSEAALMAAFVEPLRARGDRVVAFDLPAHGRSPGPLVRRAASLIDCARAALVVAEDTTRQHGPIESLIAHSLGAMIAALAVEGGVPLGRRASVRRLALIAAPDAVAGVARRYGARIGLRDRAGQHHFERQLERVGRRPLALFTTARLLAAVPETLEVLIVHALDDDVVPVADALSIAAAVPGSRLELHDGLGHAKVLYAPPVVRAVRNFLTR